MAEYWQEKRITTRQVAYSWGLLLVIFAGMLVIWALSPPCSDVAGCSEAELTRLDTAQRLR